MTVYSPSATLRWLQCPVAWLLSREWTPRAINPPRDFAAILGRAVSVGMSHVNSGAPADSALAVARQTAQAALADIDVGALTPTGQAQHAAVLPRLNTILGKMLRESPVPPEWECVSAEAIIPEAGQARPDLIIRDPMGLAPLDYKVKLSVGRDARDRELRHAELLADYARSWQMFHYDWALHEFGWRGERMGPAHRWHIVLGIVEPRPTVELHTFVVDPEAAAQWLAFARSAWCIMEEQLTKGAVPWGHTECRTVYGPCEYRAACWEHHYDPQGMARDYRKRERS